MIDYAYPCMMAEKALKELYNAAIEGRLEDAQELALEVATQARMAYIALQHTKQDAECPPPLAPAKARSAMWGIS